MCLGINLPMAGLIEAEIVKRGLLGNKDRQW